MRSRSRSGVHSAIWTVEAAIRKLLFLARHSADEEPMSRQAFRVTAYRIYGGLSGRDGRAGAEARCRGADRQSGASLSSRLAMVIKGRKVSGTGDLADFLPAGSAPTETDRKVAVTASRRPSRNQQNSQTSRWQKRCVRGDGMHQPHQQPAMALTGQPVNIRFWR